MPKSKTVKSPKATSESNVNWFAQDDSKRWCEKFFLIVTPLSVGALLLGLVGTGAYKHCGRNEYLLFSIFMALPCFMIPFCFSGEADRCRPLKDRFWVKANVWNLIFGYIGNYFWTHYFYQLLGAHYTFDSYCWNDVPIPCYLATHAYFCLYHTISSIVLRRVQKCTAALYPTFSKLFDWLFIGVLAYLTAVAETVTIAWFPHYSFDHWDKMVVYGSVFYALYFVVSFPMFFRIDEDPQNRWTLNAVALDSLPLPWLSLYYWICGEY
eukprot:jgi/Galph1/5934/GphlegSOOS_G4639.1